MKTRAMLAAAFFALAAGAAGAEVAAPAPSETAGRGAPGDVLSLGLGLDAPLGHVDFRPIGGGGADDGDLGIQLSAQYVHPLSTRLGAGLGVDYFDRSGTISPRLLSGATASVGGDSWVALGLLRWSLADRGTARPFVLVGAGGAWNTTTVDARAAAWPDTGTHETRRLIDDGAFVPAGSVRFGVDLRPESVRPGTVILEVGWTWLDSARYAATPAGRTLGLSGVSGPLNVVSLTARYGWSL